MKVLGLQTSRQADRPPKVINLSQRTLNVAESSILKRGMKFNTADVDTTSSVGNLESILSHPTTPEGVRSDVRNMVSKGTHLPKSPLERRAMASFKRDSNISILPVDKGGAVFVLDGDAYIQKAEQPLSDETTYKLLQCDPTSTI